MSQEVSTGRRQSGAEHGLLRSAQGRPPGRRAPHAHPGHQLPLPPTGCSLNQGAGLGAPPKCRRACPSNYPVQGRPTIFSELLLLRENVLPSRLIPTSLANGSRAPGPGRGGPAAESWAASDGRDHRHMSPRGQNGPRGLSDAGGKNNAPM